MSIYNTRTFLRPHLEPQHRQSASSLNISIIQISPFFAQACQAQFFESAGKRIDLLTEEPEVFSAVLEYMYKGDYSPKLVYDKKANAWSIDNDGGPKEITVQQSSTGAIILKDTAIYVGVYGS